ncbi:DUF547 domain-containing protein [Aureispira]|nr:DUF547 domain-containing protein [Aureispira sp.]
MFDHKKFSQDLKILKQFYLEEGMTNSQLIGKHIQDLSKFDLTTLQSDEQKISFWINVYNGLINYWVIEKSIKKSMLERPFLVIFSKINIGGFQFSPDDIEHGILRCNKRSKYKLCKQFSARDVRIQFKLKKMDYRIHFALNCGAKSCPAISFYSAKNLDQQLRTAENNFIEQEFIVDEVAKEISCSKIFWLYKKDFVKIYNNAPKYKSYKIRYRKYDFNLI